MTTDSAAALLNVALQDLHAGKAAQVNRLPNIASKCRDAALKDILAREADRVAAQGARLRGASADLDGPENLWMNGILDDAERDMRSTQPGRLLDIALVGAIRKAKAAEIVSSETAIALARACDAPDILAAVTANRHDEIETDQLLKGRLAALAAER